MAFTTWCVGVGSGSSTKITEIGLAGKWFEVRLKVRGFGIHDSRAQQEFRAMISKKNIGHVDQDEEKSRRTR